MFGLGILERFCVTLCDLGLDNCVIVAATYSNATTLLDRSVLYPALKRVIEEHPALSTQLVRNAEGGLHFVRLPTINLDRIVTFSDDTLASFKAIFAAELASPIRESALWRVNVLKDNTVIFAFHHAIGDGRSGLFFHQSLLKALNAPPFETSVESEAIVQTPTNLVLEEPFERVRKLSVSYITLFRLFLEKLIFPRSWLPDTYAWSGRTCPSEAHNRACVHLHAITAPEAKLLLGICRKNNCTLTSFLHTLAACVLSRIVHELNAAGTERQQYASLSAITAFDLRSVTGTSENAISTQACAYGYHVPLIQPARYFPFAKGAPFPWDLAQEFNRSLDSYREKAIEQLGLIQFLFQKRDPVKFLSRKLGQKRDHGLSMSNLGSFRIDADVSGGPGEKAWSIEDAIFCACHPATGSALTISMVGSPSGTINIVYSWGDDALEDGVADAFVLGMKEGVDTVLLCR